MKIDYAVRFNNIILNVLDQVFLHAPWCLVAVIWRSFPDFILGTVHKAKGLEFDNVMITDDFIKVPASRHSLHMRREFSPSAFTRFLFRFLFPTFCSFISFCAPCCPGKIPPDEWNLLYVAVTRAKTTLIITSSVRRILTWAGVRWRHTGTFEFHTLITSLTSHFKMSHNILSPVLFLLKCIL